MSLEQTAMIDSLETRIGYEFKDKDILIKALSHKSQANERRRKADPKASVIHNERLEFLGDAVLQLVISDILWDRNRGADEGKLSKMRSALVNEQCLAEIARKIDLGQHILLGKGEINTGGREKNSILACAYEALLGALYVEGGLEVVYGVIDKQFLEQFQNIEELVVTHDYKSLLQEKVQGGYRRPPLYRVEKEEGPDHDKIFDVVVSVGRLKASGRGRNKKEAEQSAARSLLKVLDRDEKSDADLDGEPSGNA